MTKSEKEMTATAIFQEAVRRVELTEELRKHGIIVDKRAPTASLENAVGRLQNIEE